MNFFSNALTTTFNLSSFKSYSTADTPAVCNNQYNPALIKEWQNAGKKVLLGFGGAGMGGSWLAIIMIVGNTVLDERTKSLIMLYQLSTTLGLMVLILITNTFMRTTRMVLVLRRAQKQ